MPAKPSQLNDNFSIYVRAAGLVAAIGLTEQIEGLCQSRHPFNTLRQRYAKSAFAAVGHSWHSRPSLGSLTTAAVIGS